MRPRGFLLSLIQTPAILWATITPLVIKTLLNLTHGASWSFLARHKADLLFTGIGAHDDSRRYAFFCVLFICASRRPSRQECLIVTCLGGLLSASFYALHGAITVEMAGALLGTGTLIMLAGRLAIATFDVEHRASEIFSAQDLIRSRTVLWALITPVVLKGLLTRTVGPSWSSLAWHRADLLFTGIGTYDVFRRYAFFGSLCIYAWRRPPWRECLIVTCIGGLLGASFCALHGTIAVEMAGALFGTGALIMLAGRLVIAAPGAERRASVSGLFSASLLVIFSVVISQRFLQFNGAVLPRTYDYFLYNFDGTFGFQPSSSVGIAFAAAPWLAAACGLVYGALALAISVVYAAQEAHGRRFGTSVLVVSTAAAILGYLIYWIYPAVGPVHTFRMFPDLRGVAHVPLELFWVDPTLARNCMPSLHVSWALLMWWNSRELARWAQWFTAFWLVLTVLATLGLGEHYAADLIVAVPFSLAIQAAFTRRLPLWAGARRAAWSFGLGSTISWLLLLRLGLPMFLAVPYLSWIAALITLGASARLATCLERDAINAGPLDDLRSGPQPGTFQPSMVQDSVPAGSGYTEEHGRLRGSI